MTGTRIGTHEGSTRLVLSFTHPVTYSVFVLDNPYRLVIDLPRVAWAPDQLLPVAGQGVIHRVRYGQPNPGSARVVVDLTGPAAVERTLLLWPSESEPYRLVLDITSIGLPQSPNTPRPAAADPDLPSLRPTEPSSQRGVFPATVGAAGRPLPTMPSPRGRPPTRVVVLDPGHGGKDPGAIGVSGIRESDVSLSTARATRDILRMLGPYRVVLTRDRDVFVRLRDRVAIARAAHADLFVSIHADAHENPDTRGASVYTLSERASDAEAAALAERENKADLIVGLDLSRAPADVATILIDLVQRETKNRSVRLARLLVDSLQADAPMLQDSHRFAGFAVLKAPDVPSVLIELGYLSNRQDEALLRQHAYRTRLAHAIARAVHAYFRDVEVASLPR